MRELTTWEIEQVSGGTIGDFATEGGAIGTVVGGIVTNTIRGAITGGGFGALIGASMGIGYYGTGWLLEQLS
ncbi:MAG: bacteriocin-like peptide [Pseudohongiella sp.]|nr:bacteriocin-like peptide [Pseudohongiella sp.]